VDLRTALQQGIDLLERGGVAAPRLTAEVLLTHALGRERSYLYGHPEEELSEIAWLHYGRYLWERVGGRPTQHITRCQEFYGREFRVSPDVLIPRPETEHVVEVALRVARDARAIADIGCGSGALAVTLALETGAQVTATDISPAALAVAADNARRLGARVDFVVCDLGAALASSSEDVVVCNPPYVPESDRDSLQREVRDHEPPVALYGGPAGVDVYMRLVPEAARLLRPGGWLVVELGFRLEAQVRALFDARWRELATTPDLAGWPRVLAGRYAP
jgi:release factor glutamine methyltransferase